MSTVFSLSDEQVKQYIDKIQSILVSNDLEGVYISSFDEFINEYVPMINCHRYFVTKFSGSTAECFVPQKGKVRLYVDGRYHEQADLECNLEHVAVVKVPQSQGILEVMKDDIAKKGFKKIACEGKRTTVSLYKYLDENYELSVLVDHPLSAVFHQTISKKLKPIKQVDVKLCGASVAEKLELISKGPTEAYYINAIDSLSWLTNCRGYHLPYLSSFLGSGLAVKDKIFVFIDEQIEVEVNDERIEFISLAPGVLESSLKKITQQYKIEKLMIDESMLNAADYLLLKTVMGEDGLEQKKGGLVEFHSIKNPGEIQSMKESFKKADQAIYKTICWVKKSMAQKESVSERDVYNKTTEMYKGQGAIDQSFGTIAGADANGSIIHYSDPKDDVILKESSMVLLDSGGYFDSGFATDTTRTFMAGSEDGSEKHKKIYTLVLKGVLALQNAVFKTNTCSGGLDALCRQPIYQAGYDYAHGTGHGVGIHVHEGGASISTGRDQKLYPGQVISQEPGIYIPGFGGVRIENIALVIEHPKLEGFLTFEPLVYIGFEPKLIDESLLNSQEKASLMAYEAECTKRGTSFLAS